MVEGTGTVRFTAGDIRPAADVVRRFAIAGDDITAWSDVRVVDPPDDALPEVKGLLGRVKKAPPPSAQIIYAEAPGAHHTINIEARGVHVADVLGAHGVAVPPGSDLEGNKSAVIVQVPAGATAEALVELVVAALAAILGGWQPTFEAVGVDVSDLGPFTGPTD
jgi:hypothetical protein